MSRTIHTLRRATNQIHEVDDYWVKYRFEAPPEGTVLEGVSAGGDSCGPALLWHDGQFKIAGMSSWQDHGDKPLGTYGCIELLRGCRSLWIGFGRHADLSIELLPHRSV